VQLVDFDGDGTVDLTYSEMRSYDSDGSETFVAITDDGTFLIVSTATSHFDSRGNLLTRVGTEDLHGDGTPEWIYTPLSMTAAATCSAKRRPGTSTAMGLPREGARRPTRRAACEPTSTTGAVSPADTNPRGQQLVNREQKGGNAWREAAHRNCDWCSGSRGKANGCITCGCPLKTLQFKS
jgi:hypothetical protein